MLQARNLGLMDLAQAVLRSDDTKTVRPLVRYLEDNNYLGNMPLYFVPPYEQSDWLTQLYGSVTAVRDIAEFEGEGVKARVVLIEDEDLDPAYSYLELVQPSEDSLFLGVLVYPEHMRDAMVALKNFPETAPLVQVVPRNASQLKKAVMPLGMTARYEFGEYRVTFKLGRANMDRAEEVATYSTDADDAWYTALDMFTRRAKNGGRV